MTGSCMSVFAVLWLYNRTDRRWQEHGRTEVVRHGADPSFARSFYLRYNQNSNPLTYEATDQARAPPPPPPRALAHACPRRATRAARRLSPARVRCSGCGSRSSSGTRRCPISPITSCTARSSSPSVRPLHRSPPASRPPCAGVEPALLPQLFA